MDPSADERTRHAEVLSIVSHDIRGPLGVILAAVSELLDPRVGQLTEEQRALVLLVRRSSERLTRLAANVLFLKRATTGDITLSRQPADLRDVARRAIDSFERSGEVGKKVHVDLRVPGERVSASIDGELLVQAVTNILANAIRVARTEIVVTVGSDSGAPAITVEDDGPGIPAQVQARLLDPLAPFASLEKPREREPRGLGLLVVKGIVDAHGGLVVAESRLDATGRSLGARVKTSLPG